METDARKSYEEVAKKHKLPKFEELDAEFHISSIEDAKFILTEVRHMMLDKTQGCADFLGELLQPETSLVNLYESRILGEHEKKEAYEIFRILMKWGRSALEVDIESTDAAESAYIVGLFHDWKAMKPGLIKVIKKIIGSWESDSEEVEKLGYFG